MDHNQTAEKTMWVCLSSLGCQSYCGLSTLHRQIIQTVGMEVYQWFSPYDVVRGMAVVGAGASRCSIGMEP